MEEKNINPGEKKPGEGKQWPDTGDAGKPGKTGDAGKKGGQLGETGEGDSRKTGDVDRKVHQ
ncbi:MAG TPA: hypothetical protein VGK15_02140 [Candidatus Limnocylindria bacterium]|jgi:hypothetical protein